jgi:hypothetical protein
MVDVLKFDVLGIDTNNISAVYKYVKYYPNENSFIMFNANDNELHTN